MRSYYLIMGERCNGIRRYIQVEVTDEDLKVIEPAVQRIIRNGRNPNFGINLIERKEGEKGDEQLTSRWQEGKPI